LNREAGKVGININQANIKAMHIKNKNKNTFILDRKETEDVDKLPYLGSMVIKEGGSMKM
jgi:hypothetical protein